MAWCLRSGAFAVHGRPPKSAGLSRLIELQQQLNSVDGQPAALAALAKLRLSRKQLDDAVEYRSVACVAQAVSVVVAGLRRAVTQRSCWEAATAAGSFLHVQQSLLSDLHPGEHAYLQACDRRVALMMMMMMMMMMGYAWRSAMNVAVSTRLRVTACCVVTLVIPSCTVADQGHALQLPQGHTLTPMSPGRVRHHIRYQTVTGVHRQTFTHRFRTPRGPWSC